MISVEEALERILSKGSITDIEELPLNQCLGRILAQDITSRRTQPPQAVSAMDGYALRVEYAVEGNSVIRVGEAPAGGSYDGVVNAGETVRIFTGGPVPAGADAIVLQEDVEIADDGAIIIGETAKKDQHIRPAGVDFKEGDVLLEAGRQISAADVGLLASMDWPLVPARRRPKVAILATGEELVLHGEALGPNQIVSSNSFALASLVEQAGGEALDLGIAKDVLDDIKAKTALAADCDILVTVGGASVGERDLVQHALGEMGLTLDFWKIAMRPGKPLIFGQLGEQLMIGLPGNPVSAMVCATLYLAPLIRSMLGMNTPSLPISQARLGAPLKANKARQDYMRATLEPQEDGTLNVTPFDLQDSSVLSLFAHADALIIRPPHAEEAAAGDMVPIIRLR